MLNSILAHDPPPTHDVKAEPDSTCSMGTQFCDDRNHTAETVPGHCCATDTDYLPALHSIKIDGLTVTAPPLVSACAWRDEESGVFSVHVHAISEKQQYRNEDSGYDIDLNFDPRNARVLAQQLLAAADLVDGEVAQ